MRALIILAALLALSACRSHRQTAVSTAADSLAVSATTHETAIRDSLFINARLNIDSAEITIIRPDSVRITIRAKGVKKGLTKEKVTDSRVSITRSDSTCVKKASSKNVKSTRSQNQNFILGSLALISSISITYLTARICRH